MKQRNNEEIVINKVEVATRLAHMNVEDSFEDPHEVYEDPHASMTVYTADAQKKFNNLFDMYISILEEEDRTW
jgi:hypothetical protein